jgi:hypothetical protein
MQGLTLRLRGDGLATLRTEFPGYPQTAAGTPVSPVDEMGTWIERNGFAYVHLTQRENAVAPGAAPTPQAQPESVMLSFSLKRCTLKLVGDPERVYGANGLQFTKRHCS